MTDITALKISELSPSSNPSENAFLPLSEANGNESEKVSIGTLRETLGFENAYSNIQTALTETDVSDVFFVYEDENKLYVLGYVNQGNGTYSALMSGDNKQVRIVTAKGMLWSADKIEAGVSFVTPEMSGIRTGNGIAEDDTNAVLWALSQVNKRVVFDSSKEYNIIPDRIVINGKIDVDAGNAKIICDGVAIEVIDGGGSKWTGGILESKTVPWTVVYTPSFSVSQSGYLGFGRMPYQDDNSIETGHYYQKTTCILLFRSSSSAALSSLVVKNVTGQYASIVAAGFSNTMWDKCRIRGGSLIGAISILNDSNFSATPGIGWNGNQSYVTGNTFKWARGVNHTVTNCDLFESRQMGLYISGSDKIFLSNLNLYNNAESGLQSGQYSAVYPQTSIVCTNITQINCKAWGNYYDGFDHASVTSGANGPFIDRFLTISNCESFGNRATGMFVQGNNLKISGNIFQGNGTHGLRVQDSSIVDISFNQSRNNGILDGGYQILAVGSDMDISNNNLWFDITKSDAHFINISIGIQSVLDFTVRFRGSQLSNYSSPHTVIGVGVLIESNVTLSDGSQTFVSGIRASNYIPRPIAGNTELKYLNSEAGAVQAWKHPYTGSFLRLYTDDLTQSTTGPFVFSYNHGKNTTNQNGYADNAGIGGLKVSYYPTSFRVDVYAAGNPITPAGGFSGGATGFSPTVDNQSALGATSLRWTQLIAANSTINTSDKRKKRGLRLPTEQELGAFYKISQLPSVWQWIEKYEIEGENARLHSGPTVQDAIEIMIQHGLDWTQYSAFCYDKWDKKDAGVNEITGQFEESVEAGENYSFRKEELLLWITRALVEKQKNFEERLSSLESIQGS